MWLRSMIALGVSELAGCLSMIVEAENMILGSFGKRIL